MAIHELNPQTESNQQMKYYDLKKNWRKVRPHLVDKELNDILVRDFKRFTLGHWRRKFTYGRLPCEFDSVDWRSSHRGRHPAFWNYTCHGACHWLVNFNLRLAMLVMPDRSWRIISSDSHSTVWDGGDLLLDFNCQALGIEPNECFDHAFERELQRGEYLDIGFAEHYTLRQRQLMADRATEMQEQQTTSISHDGNLKEANEYAEVLSYTELLVLHVATRYILRHDEMAWLAEGYNRADRSTRVRSRAIIKSLVEAGLLEGNGRGEQVALAGPDEGSNPIPMLWASAKGKKLLAEIAETGFELVLDDDTPRLVLHTPEGEMDGIGLEEFDGGIEIGLAHDRVLLLLPRVAAANLPPEDESERVILHDKVVGQNSGLAHDRGWLN